MTLFCYKPRCFSYVDHTLLMLTSLHLHMKSSEVCIKTRSPPASLPIQGQVTKHTTVKWPITRKEAVFGKTNYSSVCFSLGTTYEQNMNKIDFLTCATTWSIFVESRS